MLIQINTDSNIEGDTELAQEVETVVRDRFNRFSEQITRMDVTLSDENSDKKVGIDAKRCVLVADLAGLQPISVSDQASTVKQAVAGATKKMQHLLTSTLGRLSNRT
jgi:ribosome-associated translation inhibitor RaiA